MSERRAAVVENVFARCACIEDCVGDFKIAYVVVDASPRTRRVATDRAISNHHVSPFDAAAAIAGGVAADRAVSDRQKVTVDAASALSAEFPLIALLTMATPQPPPAIPPPKPGAEFP